MQFDIINTSDVPTAKMYYLYNVRSENIRLIITIFNCEIKLLIVLLFTGIPEVIVRQIFG